MAGGAPLTVTPERGRRDRRAFIDLPYRLYEGHPVWVPPLRMAERDLMDRSKNPFFEHAEVEHFLARRGDRVVGRVAAVENRRHNEVHEDRVGFFGFFDVEEGDQEAATALIGAARAWIDAKGLTPLRGPVNYSTNDSCGVLVEGFDEPPKIMMPYNRRDYDALLMGAGLQKAKDLVTLWMSTSVENPERFERVVNRRLERSGITIRDIDVARIDQEAEVLKDVYNRSWEKNWGFVPATDAEFDHGAKDLKLVLMPRISGVAMKDDRAVGMSVFITDINVLLKGSNGRLFPTLWWKLLRGLKKVRSSSRCVLLGIVPEARGSALAEAFVLRALNRGREDGWAGSEAGWILEDNEAMLNPLRMAGGVQTKRYRIYESK